MFSVYDAIISAPGPFLADYDRRAPSALADIAAAAELGRLVILSSHSIGPLSPEGLEVVARASIRTVQRWRGLRKLIPRGYKGRSPLFAREDVLACIAAERPDGPMHGARLATPIRRVK